MSATLLAAYQAAAAVAPPVRRWFGVAGLRLCVDVAGPELAERLFAPMAHIEIDPSADLPASITIKAWSEAETSVSNPAGEVFEWSEPGGDLIIASLPGARLLQRLTLARPFQRALVSLLADRELPSVHGGLIAVSEGQPGLLLIGPNGSGKSTSCLSAVFDGFRLVGEDCLAIERTQTGYRGHSLYCSCNLTVASRQMFGTLPGPLLFPPDAPPDAKAVMLLPAAGAQSPMVRSLAVDAVVFPEIAGRPGESKTVPIGVAEAYRRLMPGLRLMRYFEPSQRQDHHDRLAGMIADLPCYRLDLGSDIEAIPTALRKLSATLSGTKAAVS